MNKYSLAELIEFIKAEIDSGHKIKELFIKDKLPEEVKNVEVFIDKLTSIKEELYILRDLRG